MREQQTGTQGQECCCCCFSLNISTYNMFLTEIIHQREKTGREAKGDTYVSATLAHQQKTGSSAHVVTLHMWLWCR